MTNTIPNVPRELLERCAQYTPTLEKQEDRARALSELRALLSAPSPAGVDGLEVVAYRTEWTARDAGSKRVSFGSSVPCQDLVRQDYPEAVLGEAEPLCRLSDAQAIIDGLRAEVERLDRESQNLSDQLGACGRDRNMFRAERDQMAQRIGELEGLFRAESARVDFLDAYIVTADAPDTGKVAMLADSGTLRECIDAALSAGKEGE